MDRVAKCLQGLDLVGLNEVHGRWLWQRLDQAELLGRRLGRAWLFAPAVRQYYHYDFGNGLLSTLPIRSWQRIPLDVRPGNSPRNIVLAELTHRGRPFRAVITHLPQRDPAQRQAEFQTVIAMFLAAPQPAILLGDMNAKPQDPQIRQLLDTPGVIDPLGAATDPQHRNRIDWIFLRGLRAVGAGVGDGGASDHPRVWAEVEF